MDDMLDDIEENDTELVEERKRRPEDDEDDSFDEDKLTEESYRTTYETNPEDLNYEAEEISDEEEFWYSDYLNKKGNHKRFPFYFIFYRHWQHHLQDQLIHQEKYALPAVCEAYTFDKCHKLCC